MYSFSYSNTSFFLFSTILVRDPLFLGLALRHSYYRISNSPITSSPQQSDIVRFMFGGSAVQPKFISDQPLVLVSMAVLLEQYLLEQYLLHGAILKPLQLGSATGIHVYRRMALIGILCFDPGIIVQTGTGLVFSKFGSPSSNMGGSEMVDGVQLGDPRLTEVMYFSLGVPLPGCFGHLMICLLVFDPGIYFMTQPGLYMVQRIGLYTPKGSSLYLILSISMLLNIILSVDREDMLWLTYDTARVPRKSNSSCNFDADISNACFSWMASENKAAVQLAWYLVNMSLIVGVRLCNRYMSRYCLSLWLLAARDNFIISLLSFHLGLSILGLDYAWDLKWESVAHLYSISAVDCLEEIFFSLGCGNFYGM